MGLPWIFSMALVSMILITSQTPAAFAGIDEHHDADGDGFSPKEGDCDDTDENIYPGNGCDYPVREDIENIENQIDDLIDSEDFDINDAQVDNLLYKLQHAAEKVEADQINVAINNLRAFINQINAYILADQISQADGDGLIAEVQAIIDYLKSS